jgi:hypothetical protein
MASVSPIKTAKPVGFPVLRVEDELDSLRKRYALMEGDKRAFQESAQLQMQQNKDRMAVLRAENQVCRVGWAHA